jgi:hypothetical protein
MDPAEVIVPVVGCGANGQVEAFLGTGFFVGPEGLLMTAEHVVRDWTGPIAISCMKDLSRGYSAVVVERDVPHDLALLRVKGYQPPTVLKLGFDAAVNPNIQVLAFEYGTTRQAGKSIVLSPATRLGNITRIVDMPMLGPAGDRALELSFPALRGASGAPVMRSDDYTVWGVVVSNVSYHLLPAQIESVLDEENSLYEEIKYLLPQAAAVRIHHARGMFERQMASSPGA